MPFRLFSPPQIARAPFLRLPPHLRAALFSTTCARFDDTELTHYEVLEVQPSASPAEIKKRFYALSLSHHPDKNLNNPKSGETFARISHSYHVLADPMTRKRYDRDHIHPRHARSRHGPTPSSGSYAGSRPASGLSKRRGAFRGPPPSFYSQKNSSARARRAESSTAHSQSQSHGGFGPAGATSDSENDVPHFNRSATYRAQVEEDNRRSSRQQTMMDSVTSEMNKGADFWIRFFVVGGIVGMGSALVTAIYGTKKETKRR